MSKLTKIALIVEGTKTEPQIFKNIRRIFFNKYDLVSIMLPACTNIYTLWKRIYDDEDLDIIDLVKELSSTQDITNVNKFNNHLDLSELNSNEFSEVYLFFDYDGHNNNLPKGVDVNNVLKKMFDIFDNETEHGKIYISYPMIESIKHFSSYTHCDINNSCVFPIQEGPNYKRIVSECTICHNLLHIDLHIWYFIIMKFLISISCLLDLDRMIDMCEYKEVISPKIIFNFQKRKYINSDYTVMIISAIPEFILDYYSVDSLKEILNKDSFSLEEYPCKQCNNKYISLEEKELV